MPFRYEAYNKEARLVRGTIDAETREAAEQSLWDGDLTIIALNKIGKPFRLHEQLPSLFGVRSQDVIAFANQLAILINAGINIYAALQIIRDQTEKAAFRTVLSQVIVAIGEGSTLAEACERHPLVFPPLFLRLIRVGEETGRVGDMLRRVAGYMERQKSASSKVKSSLAYPIFVLCTAGIAIYILMTVALPNLIGLFKEFKAELPLSTRAVIWMAGFAGTYGTLIAFGVLAMIVGIILYKRTESGSRRVDRLTVRLPVLGSIVVKLNLARFADTMGSLIGSGIPLTEAMELLGQASQNAAVSEPLRQIRGDVLGGASLSQAMSRHAIFPPLMVNLTRVGEETGSMETTFETLGRIYNEEADRSIGRLIAMLEPALTIFVGAAIGLVSITIISTIYSIMPQIK